MWTPKKIVFPYACDTFQETNCRNIKNTCDFSDDEET